VIALEGPPAVVAALAFSPDGRLIAAASKGLAVWGVADGQLVSKPKDQAKELPAATATPLVIAFLPDGQLAVVPADGTLVIADPSDPKRTLLRLPGGGPATTAAFAPSGRAVLLSGPELRLTTLDGGLAWSASPGHGQPQRYGGVAISPEGNRVVAALNRWAIDAKTGPDHAHELRRLDPSTGRKLAVLAGGPRCVDHLVWSPRGDRLAGLAGHRLWLWNVETGEPTGPLSAGGTGLFSRPAFDPTGRRLLAGGVNVDGGVYVWDAETGSELRGYSWPIGRVFAVAISPDGRLAAAGGESGQIVLWPVD
jgi:WD40 repeat protein